MSSLKNGKAVNNKFASQHFFGPNIAYLKKYPVFLFQGFHIEIERLSRLLVLSVLSMFQEKKA
jgi:hypothetical protein